MEKKDAEGHRGCACVFLGLSVVCALLGLVIGIFTGFTETKTENKEFLWLIPYNVKTEVRTFAGKMAGGGLGFAVLCLVWLVWAQAKVSEAEQTASNDREPPHDGAKRREKPSDHNENQRKKQEQPRDDAAQMAEAEKEKHYLSILGLGSGASKADIGRAYREKMKQCHPDKVNDLDQDFRRLAEKKAMEINEAHDYLSGKSRKWL